MEIVGIRELKTHLSDYIRKVRVGESVVITDRGVQVAELRPLSPEVRAALQLVEEGRAQVVATSVVAYPEVMSALSHRTRAGDLTAAQRDSLSNRFDTHWGQYLVLPVADRAAGGLALEHGLRGFDAAHLAAACAIGEQSIGGSVVFSSFDHALNEAARAEGFSVLTVE